jgi:uncharacterized protein
MTQWETDAFGTAEDPPAAIEIVRMFYHPESPVYKTLIHHGRQVAEKAVSAAQAVPELNPDIDFLREASFLHDIGIFLTNTPKLGCAGEKPYVCHGYLGRKILEALGLPRHARVCERHVGVGLTKTDIERHNLPLPPRDMLPETLEEQIICYADKFFSKDRPSGQGKKSLKNIIAGLTTYGTDNVERFLAWHQRFSEPAKKRQPRMQ